jgi:hypothetical protein
MNADYQGGAPVSDPASADFKGGMIHRGGTQMFLGTRRVHHGWTRMDTDPEEDLGDTRFTNGHEFFVFSAFFAVN